MNRLRRTLIAASPPPLAPVPFALRAQQAATAATPRCRTPLPVENPAKIEVVEFFWYGCIHCYNLEPVLEAWLPKLPPDAYFRRIPAVFNERWAHDAAIYYAFEALGVLGQAAPPVLRRDPQGPPAHRQPGSAQRVAEEARRRSEEIRRRR